MRRRYSAEATGPDYTISSPALVKHRRKAGEGLASLPRAERQAYGAAVEAAVLAAQRRQLATAGEVMPRPRCASGTWHNDGAAIHDAVRDQQRRSLLACASQIRRARTPEQWERMYREAMPEGFVPSWERKAATEREAMAEAQAIAERVMAGGPIFPEPVAEAALPCAA